MVLVSKSCWEEKSVLKLVCASKMQKCVPEGVYQFSNMHGVRHTPPNNVYLLLNFIF